MLILAENPEKLLTFEHRANSIVFSARPAYHRRLQPVFHEASCLAFWAWEACFLACFRVYSLSLNRRYDILNEYSRDCVVQRVGLFPLVVS